MARQTIHLKKSYTPLNKKENNSTIETKFDQYGNKVSMFETLKKSEWEIVTKDNNISLTREPTSLLLS